MDRLPLELLNLITSYVHVTGAKNLGALRATCRAMNDLISPRLFHRLHVSCHTLDIFIFNLIVSNPTYAAGVEEIVIDDTTFATQLYDRDLFNKLGRDMETHWPLRILAYDHEYGEIVEYPKPPGGWSKYPNKTCFEKWKDLNFGHQYNLLYAVDYFDLMDALPKLPNVKKIVLSNRTADETHEKRSLRPTVSPMTRAWRGVGNMLNQRLPFPPRCDWTTDSPSSAYTEEYIDLSDFLPLKHLFDVDLVFERLHNRLADEISNAPQRGASCRFGNVSFAQGHWRVYGEPGPRTYPMWDQRFRAVQRESRGLKLALEPFKIPTLREQITEFRIDCSYEDIGLQAAPGLSSRVLRPCEGFKGFLETMIHDFSLAPNLTKFSLVVNNCDPRPPLDFDSTSEGLTFNLSRVLRSLPNLEELYLEPHGASLMPIFSPWATEFFSEPETALEGDFIHSRLKKVTFCCGVVCPLKLLSFIENHRKTLESLVVEYCQIGPVGSSQDWTALFGLLNKKQKNGETSMKSIIFWCVSPQPIGRLCGKSGTLFKRYPKKGDDLFRWYWTPDGASELAMMSQHYEDVEMKLDTAGTSEEQLPMTLDERLLAPDDEQNESGNPDYIGILRRDLANTIEYSSEDEISDSGESFEEDRKQKTVTEEDMTNPEHRFADALEWALDQSSEMMKNRHLLALERLWYYVQRNLGRADTTFEPELFGHDN